jgi:hypothetical protein
VREKEKGEEEERTAPLPSRGVESNCDRNFEQ